MWPSLMVIFSPHQWISFAMTALDIPEQLVLHGTSDEDVASTLSQLQKRVELKSDLDTSQDEINKRAVRLLPLFFKNLSFET